MGLSLRQVPAEQPTTLHLAIDDSPRLLHPTFHRVLKLVHDIREQTPPHDCGNLPRKRLCLGLDSSCFTRDERCGKCHRYLRGPKHVSTGALQRQTTIFPLLALAL